MSLAPHIDLYGSRSTGWRGVGLALGAVEIINRIALPPCTIAAYRRWSK